jgi:Fe-S cluster assembly iron-binding protein IscA
MIRKFFGVLLFSPVFFGLFAVATLAQAATSKSPAAQCVRSIPQPIVKKSVFPNANFTLKDIDYVGVIVPLGLETVELSNGDKVAITNSGCENFTLSFQFETSRFTGQVQDTKYWFARSVELMKQLEPGLETSINLKQGINVLDKYTRDTANPAIGHEIDYGDQEIRSIVQLADVKELGNQSFAVKVIFSIGPL